MSMETKKGVMIMNHNRQKKKKKNQLPIRVNLLFLFVFLLFAGLILRLGIVQIVEGEQFQRCLKNKYTERDCER